MKRRRALKTIGALCFTHLPSLSQSKKSPPFQINGNGPSMMLCGLGDAFAERLSGSYRMISLSYPPTGEAARRVEQVFTPERVCDDILAAADAAGAARFAWFGYSWGAVVGLYLASRTDRLSALICGGWPPLGVSYKEMTHVCAATAERTGQAKNFVTFYRGMEEWPARESIRKFRAPRMAFAGTDDVITNSGVTVRIGPLLAEHRPELESMGWVVKTFNGFRHDLFAKPAVVCPVVLAFLNTLNLR